MIFNGRSRPGFLATYVLLSIHGYVIFAFGFLFFLLFFVEGAFGGRRRERILGYGVLGFGNRDWRRSRFVWVAVRGKC